MDSDVLKDDGVPAAAAEPPAPRVVVNTAPPPLWRRLWAALRPVTVPKDEAEDYDKRFAENVSENLFRGVFETPEAAGQSAPTIRPIGYDNAESAALYFNRMRHEQFDYPAMFWLQRSLYEGMRTIFDVGGHVGIKFFAFREPLDFPDDISWLVCDVPSVIGRGVAVSTARRVTRHLKFTSRYDELSGHDVLFASGALQYLPMTLGDWLKSVDPLPKRIIINTTPLHPTLEYFTLNSIGVAFCPYRVMALQPFVDSVTAHGYVLRDRWINDSKRLDLPGYPEHSLDHYSGFCFDLAKS